MHQSAAGGRKAFSSHLAGMTSADTSAPSFDPSLAEPKGSSLRRWLAPFAVAIALLSAFLTFVVLTGLTPIEPTSQGRRFLPADQRRDHPAAGRHHRPRSLEGGAGPAPRPGGGTAACPDRQPVLGYCRAAGRAGGDRRQRHHRSRPRPAVFGADARGDPELADRGQRLSARARAAHSRRYSGDGQRHRQCPAAVRPGSRHVSPGSDRQCRLAQPSGRHADRQGTECPGNGSNRHPADLHDAAAGFPQQCRRKRTPDRGVYRSELRRGRDPAARVQRHLPLCRPPARSPRGRPAQADRGQRRRICPA